MLIIPVWLAKTHSVQSCACIWLNFTTRPCQCTPHPLLWRCGSDSVRLAYEECICLFLVEQRGHAAHCSLYAQDDIVLYTSRPERIPKRIAFNGKRLRWLLALTMAKYDFVESNCKTFFSLLSRYREYPGQTSFLHSKKEGPPRGTRSCQNSLHNTSDTEFRCSRRLEN